MELTGKLIKKLPSTNGTGNKPWTKQEFVIETPGQYPKQVCFSAWNDKAQEVAGTQLEENLKISFDLESREYNNRWYTEAKAWKIEIVESASKPKQPVAADHFKEEEHEDDLPF